MILLLQRVYGIETFGSFVILHGVELHVVYMRCYLLRNVLQLDIAVVQSVGHFLRFVINVGYASQLRRTLAHLVHNAHILASQTLVGLVQHTLYVLGMTHHLCRLFERLLFAVYKIGVGEFLLLKTQEVLVLPIALNLLLHTCQFVLRLAILAVRRLIVGQLRLVVGDDVHHIQLEVLAIEQQVLVLAVYVDELFAQFAYQRQRHRRVVDESPTLAVGVHLASEQTFFRLIVEIVALEEVLQHVRVIHTQVERSLNDTLVAPTLHHLGVRPIAQQQSDSPYDDTLASSRLARDNGESGIEEHLQMVYKRKVSYVKFFQHSLFLYLFPSRVLAGIDTKQYVVNTLFLLLRALTPINVGKFVALVVGPYLR